MTTMKNQFKPWIRRMFTAPERMTDEDRDHAAKFFGKERAEALVYAWLDANEHSFPADAEWGCDVWGPTGFRPTGAVAVACKVGDERRAVLQEIKGDLRWAVDEAMRDLRAWEKEQACGR